MIQQLMFGGTTTTIHTSQVDGINLLFSNVSTSLTGSQSASFTVTYTPGIPVSSNVVFYLENSGDKNSSAVINPGQPDSVSSPGNQSVASLSYSGTITSIRINYSTADDNGDSFQFSVAGIDGAQNYTKVNSTTLSIP